MPPNVVNKHVVLFERPFVCIFYFLQAAAHFWYMYKDGQSRVLDLALSAYLREEEMFFLYPNVLAAKMRLKMFDCFAMMA